MTPSLTPLEQQMTPWVIVKSSSIFLPRFRVPSCWTSWKLLPVERHHSIMTLSSFSTGVCLSCQSSEVIFSRGKWAPRSTCFYYSAPLATFRSCFCQLRRSWFRRQGNSFPNGARQSVAIRSLCEQRSTSLLFNIRPGALPVENYPFRHRFPYLPGLRTSFRSRHCLLPKWLGIPYRIRWTFPNCSWRYPKVYSFFLKS